MEPVTQYAQYEVEGWGVGELVLTDDGVLLHHEAPRPGLVAQGRKLHPLARRFRDWFRGSRDDFLDVELDLEGYTPFSRALVDALRAVPYGEVVTYGELSALAGRVRAARAAGTFCANNRFALVVPCHRVVSVGGIGGYGPTGVEYKRRLLEVENVSL
jgi:methylated-DNA-[protein]-cysteine S-methyltransferase